MVDEYDYSVKCILLGDAFVGKTTLAERMCDIAFEMSENSPTIGVDFRMKRMERNGVKLKFQIWDTSGQENFKAITKSYFRTVAVAIVVFSYDNHRSFENIRQWIEDLYSTCVNRNLLIYIVGNKADLAHHVEQYEIDAFCNTRIWRQHRLLHGSIFMDRGDDEEDPDIMMLDDMMNRLDTDPRRSLMNESGDSKKLDGESTNVESVEPYPFFSVSCKKDETMSPLLERIFSDVHKVIRKNVQANSGKQTGSLIGIYPRWDASIVDLDGQTTRCKMLCTII